jgi:poly(3-hydroxybutyrate) depolymerase
MQIVVVVGAVVVSLVLAIVLLAFTGRDRSVLFGGSRSIEVDGVRRTFLVSKTGAKPRDLVIGLHGYGGDGRQFAYYTALHNAFGSDTVVVYPDASKPQARQTTGWNADFCCGSGWKNKVDDVGFLEALISLQRQTYGIAADRVFLVGFSNGAFMAQRFAADRPGLVRAVVSGAGTIGTTGANGRQLQPTPPVPMLLTHGTKDVRVAYGGGTSPGDPEFDWLSFATTKKPGAKRTAATKSQSKPRQLRCEPQRTKIARLPSSLSNTSAMRMCGMGQGCSTYGPAAPRRAVKLPTSSPTSLRNRFAFRVSGEFPDPRNVVGLSV